MKKLQARLRAWLAAASVPAVTLVSTLSAAVLVGLPPPAAAIDCWVDAEHPSTGDQRAVGDPAVAPMRQAVASMRQVDPAAAEKMGAELRVQFRDAREAEARSARRRATPALLGLNGPHDPAVPLDRYPHRVKPDPNFPRDRQHPARPQMLKVSIQAGDVFAEPMQRVLQRLDLRALQALVD